MLVKKANPEAVKALMDAIQQSSEYSYEKFLKAKNVWNGVEDSGGSNIKVKCPFHLDKTPSMLFDSDNDRWHCFSCDRGGNLVNLMVMFNQQVEKTGLGFYQVLNNMLVSDARLRLLSGFTSVYRKEKQNVLETGFTRRKFVPREEPKIANYIELASVMKREKMTRMDMIKLAILYVQDGYDPESVLSMVKGDSISSSSTSQTFAELNINDILAGISLGGS